MAQIIIQTGGSGGGKSDDCTAKREHVVEDYTAITQDSDDEIVYGTMKNYKNDTLYTGSSFIINDNYYIDVPKGAYIRKDLQGAGGRIVVPRTKVASDGGVTSNKILQGQTALGINGTATSDANAVAHHMIQGETAYVKGAKITGTMTVNSVVSFKVATYSTTQVIATWSNPSKGPYSGFAICAKQGGYPTNINDSRVYTGIGTNANLSAANSIIISGLASGITYYFRIWTYCNTSNGDMHSGYQQGVCATTASGRVVFNQSGTFTVPANVRTLKIHCVGGGGAGGGEQRSRSMVINGVQPRGSYITCGGGGGGGWSDHWDNFSVTPGQVLNINVGAGGKVNTSSALGGNGGDGGETNVVLTPSHIYRAGGGQGGKYDVLGANAGDGGDGGSGGGSGTSNAQSRGGSNGGDGTSYYVSSYWKSNGGKGQGHTTKEFGTGTQYSGGGAGASNNEFNNIGGSIGGGNGACGRGNHSNYKLHATPGSANTGGGGGAGFRRIVDDDDVSGNRQATGDAADGGSGVVIIAW